MIISVSLTKEDLVLIDEYCEGIGIPRSKFFIRCALKEVGVHKKDIDAAYGKPSKKKEVSKKTKRVFSKLMGKYVDV